MSCDSNSEEESDSQKQCVHETDYFGCQTRGFRDLTSPGEDSEWNASATSETEGSSLSYPHSFPFPRQRTSLKPLPECAQDEFEVKRRKLALGDLVSPDKESDTDFSSDEMFPKGLHKLSVLERGPTTRSKDPAPPEQAPLGEYHQPPSVEDYMQPQSVGEYKPPPSVGEYSLPPSIGEYHQPPSVGSFTDLSSSQRGTLELV